MNLRFLNSILYVFLGVALFSCERAHEPATATVTLLFSNPNSQVAANSVLSPLGFSGGGCPVLASLSTLGTVETMMCSGGGGTSGETFAAGLAQQDYLTIVPDSTSSTRVNCLLVAVGAGSATTKEDYNLMSSSYCGKKSSTTLEVTPVYSFGPWSGLIYFDSTSTGQKVPLTLSDVPIGNDRQFYVFGYYAASKDACADLKTNPLMKAQLSKPYIIGYSQAVDVYWNMPTVPISTVKATSSPTTVDDCVLTSGYNPLPEASHVVIDVESFPYANMSSYASIPTGYMCEPLTVALKYRDLSKGYITAKTSVKRTFAITVDGSQISTYANEGACVGDVPGTAAAATFEMSTAQNTVTRWVRQVGTETQVKIYKPIDQSATPLLSQDKSITNISEVGAAPASPLFIDLIMPKQIAFNTCYEGSALVRNIEGHVQKNFDTATALNFASTFSAGQFIFYSNYANCSNSTSPINSLSLPQFSWINSFYFKWVTSTFQPNTSYTFRMNYSENVSGQYLQPGASIFLNTNSPNADIVSASYNNVVVKPEIKNSAGLCVPLYVSFVTPDGDEAVNKSSALMKDLRWKNVDGGLPDPTGYEIYQQPDCSTGGPVYPKDSSFLSTGTPVSISVGMSFYKLYIKALGTNSGSKKIQFYYGTTPIGQAKFLLTDPAH